MAVEPAVTAVTVETTRVLACEDSNTQAELIRSFLLDERLAGEVGSRFSVTRTADLAGTIAQLSRDERFDVVLLDLTLPDSDGIETLDAVTAATSLPVVVLSASTAAVGFEVLDRGAQDFVVKDARSLAGLPRALRYAIKRAALTRDLEEALQAREAADQRLRTFVSMASHELRGPLAALTGLSTLLTARWDQMDDVKRRELVDRIHLRLGHAGAVATLYLNAAAGNDEIAAVAQDVDLGALADELAATVPTAPDEVAVEGHTSFDPSHLAAIVVNLLTNAAKYGASPVRLEGDGQSLVVSDAGPGVPDEEVETLFVPWHRQATDGVDSTGLGLALSAQLAAANGARLGYERRAGRTCFVLRLPVSA